MILFACSCHLEAYLQSNSQGGEKLIPVLRTVPISDMKLRQTSVLGLLPDGPVVLMQRSTPAAVMVTPDMWNHTAARMAMLEGFIDAMQIASRDEQAISLEELCAELNLDPKRLTTLETTSG